MLSEKIRRNPHIVDQQMQHKWADKVAKLERVARAANAFMDASWEFSNNPDECAPDEHDDLAAALLRADGLF